MTAAHEFTRIFRGEHRQVRDTLLDLIEAFEARDLPRVRGLLSHAAIVTGPHFRYEEESLYPALTDLFGEEYIDKLLGDHDRAIGSAKRLVELAGKSVLTNGDVAQAIRLIRGILPHVSDCDGLSIMVERFAEAQVHSILDARDRSRAEGLDLLRWADGVRNRPVVVAGPS
jgi:hypothetical protein